MLTTQNNPWVKDFPILAADENGNRLVYLDSAATTQHPMQVLNAVVDYYTKENANPHRGVYELAMRATDAHEGARHTVAQFFNAEDDEIVFTQNTTESLNLVAYSYGMNFCMRAMKSSSPWPSTTPTWCRGSAWPRPPARSWFICIPARTAA